MDSEDVIAIASLPDDLVVEIVSRVPFKSFCRFKCVCKAWLAFSSDSHYHQKLPKIPTGLLHHGRDGRSAIQLVSFSPNDEQIDGALTFVPRYDQLELVDCCNGLVLCKYKSSDSDPDDCSFIVCNPATREWRTLPVPESHGDPRRRRVGCRYTTFLAFDPSWSAQFYVLNFLPYVSDGWPTGTSKLEVFSSDLSMWLVYDAWIRYHHEIEVMKPHSFIGGVLHVQTSTWDILVVEGLEAISSGVAPQHSIIELPAICWDGCFVQSSSGLSLCAFPEESYHTVEVFSFDACSPCKKWSLEHRLSMRDAFGRDNFVRAEDNDSLYEIVALDLERGALVLFETEPKKLLSYDISTGKLSEVKDARFDWSYHYCYYVACYSKLPG